MGGVREAGTFSRRAALSAALLALLLPVAFAMPKFRVQAIGQFHYDQGNPLWEYDRRVMACSYCHVKESGGAPWNSFGQALQAQFQVDAAGGQKNRFPQVLYALLKAQQDSDGDGYADALEVFARTLPGDAKSQPQKPVAELEKAFEAAGGVEQYAPSKPQK
ncbi:hypothetical protein [Deinococcus fonticola]|uniref:hypothetical protein n=1 Tax=Deinococcus fonticola TaxID=2528713 RepID=UPI001F110E91|nr:hypothetical protein [Deinococcus fonticola]